MGRRVLGGRSFGWRRRRHHCRLCGGCIWPFVRLALVGLVLLIIHFRFDLISVSDHFLFQTFSFRILMPNKIHHHHRQLNLHELVMPPMIPYFRHSSSSNSDKPVGRGFIQFRKTACSSYATYNTMVWRYFTCQKGGLVSDFPWTTRFTRTRKARSTLPCSSVHKNIDIKGSRWSTTLARSIV